MTFVHVKLIERGVVIASVSLRERGTVFVAVFKRWRRGYCLCPSKRKGRGLCMCNKRDSLNISAVADILFYIFVVYVGTRHLCTSGVRPNGVLTVCNTVRVRYLTGVSALLTYVSMWRCGFCAVSLTEGGMAIACVGLRERGVAFVFVR